MKKPSSKLLSIIILTFLCVTAFAQEKKKGIFSFALASGVGYSALKKVNEGGYAETTATRDFKYKPLYWSASAAAIMGVHELGIEFEKQKCTSDMTTQEGVNITMKTEQELKFAYFNLYYKFLIPYQYKKFSPYLKAGLINTIYSYSENRSWTNTSGPPGSDSDSNAGWHGSFSLHVGTNYSLNDNISAFTELGLGIIFCKFGMRYTLGKK
jgi:opacity protein-like surface antigen